MDGFERYYSDGRRAEQFERMALVRLRPVAGDAALGERMMRARDAFVYSGRPLDLGNCRHLRAPPGDGTGAAGQVSAKYSAGGLVDIEYYVQAWQIGVGHADPSVRVTNTLTAIDRLVASGRIRR